MPRQQIQDSLLQQNDVTCSTNGGKIIFATDDFFAVAENLIKVEEPEWREGVYTEFGKWMDGWETRRKRKPGHDFCILEMAAPAVIQGVDVNTAHFTGNHAPTVSIQAARQLPPQMTALVRQPRMGSEASDDEIKLASVSQTWTTILEPTTLQPGYPATCHNIFAIVNDQVWRYLRLNLFPDGGVARLRTFGKVFAPEITQEQIDLAAFVNGGECVSFSNAHFGHPKNLISPNKGFGMADGWETARRLDRPRILKELPNGLLNHSGCEWCVLKLGHAGRITNLVIDTNHFKGNFPDLVKIEAAKEIDNGNESWETIVPFSKVTAHKEHFFAVSSDNCFQFVRLTIQPDGGISRLRVFGYDS